jgi:hypothetical protein
MDAREALKQAHRIVEKHLQPADPKKKNPLMEPRMHRVFTQLLVQVSNDDPDDRIVAWDDVHATVPLCISLVPELGTGAEAATKVFNDIVAHAEKLAPTYVTPPAFV